MNDGGYWRAAENRIRILQCISEIAKLLEKNPMRLWLSSDEICACPEMQTIISMQLSTFIVIYKQHYFE